MKRYVVFQSKICMAFYMYDDESNYQRIQGYEVWALKKNKRAGKRLTRKTIEEKLIIPPTIGRWQSRKSAGSLLYDCASGSGVFKVTTYKL